MRVSDIMKTRVQAVDGELPVELAKAKMTNLGIRHLVVMRDDHVAGVISDRDIAKRSIGPGLEWTVSDLMTSHVIVAAPEMTLQRAAMLMRGHTIGCLPVVEGKRLVGIITTSDLLELIAAGNVVARKARGLQRSS